ncbi:MAG: Fe-S cluster assembly protein IscX [Thiohalomonadales bacterium]
MKTRWTDTIEIAIALDEKHPDVDPLTISFPELMQWCLQLPEFDDVEERCGEKILEAIQMAWIDEKD